MRFVTFLSDSAQPHVGLLRDQTIVDLTNWHSPGDSPARPFLDLVDLIALGEEGLVWAREALSTIDSRVRSRNALVPYDPKRLLAPIPRPRKNIVCLGRNYTEHKEESLRAFNEKPLGNPDYPIFFTKAPTTVIGPYDDIPFDPSTMEELDWEVELAVIIGKRGTNIRRDDATGYIFGYMVLNDLSARDIQRRHGGQWFKGKSLDGTCPTGPCIVTAEDIEPDRLELRTRVNGVEKQRDSTSSMMFDIPAIIESLSEGMTLEPGDIIATGTPAGVGHARRPPEFLRPGDVVESEIERIGVLRNRVGSGR